MTHWRGLRPDQRKMSGRKKGREKERRKASPILEPATPIWWKSQPVLWGKKLSFYIHSQERSQPPAVPHCKPPHPTTSLQAVLDGSSAVFCQLPFWFHGKRYLVSRSMVGDPNTLLRQRGRLVRVGSTSPWPHCHVLAPGKLHTIAVSL